MTRNCRTSSAAIMMGLVVAVSGLTACSTTSPPTTGAPVSVVTVTEKPSSERSPSTVAVPVSLTENTQTSTSIPTASIPSSPSSAAATVAEGSELPSGDLHTPTGCPLTTLQLGTILGAEINGDGVHFSSNTADRSTECGGNTIIGSVKINAELRTFEDPSKANWNQVLTGELEKGDKRIVSPDKQVVTIHTDEGNPGVKFTVHTYTWRSGLIVLAHVRQWSGQGNLPADAHREANGDRWAYEMLVAAMESSELR